MVRQEAVNLPTVGSIPTSSAIPFGDTPNMSKAFPKVREAREALRARAEEIINLYMQNARQAVAAGEFEAAAKALQHAHAVADQMAKGLNAHLGALLYASNQQPQSPVLYDRVASMMAPPPPPPPVPLAINPQKIEQSATVYAVFAIE